MKNTFIIRELKVKYSQKTSKLNKIITDSTISSPENIWNYTRDYFEAEPVESVLAIFLNSANKIIGYTVVSKGTINQSLIHPREVFKGAVLANASAVILTHNHPSGNLNPSEEDLSITERVRKAGDILGINLLDHIIVSDAGFYSLRENGYF